jgi:hypothetical protein
VTIIMAPPKNSQKTATSASASSRGNSIPMSAGSLPLDLKAHWRVGRKLGEGAQASVHALLYKTGKESDDFVVKVAMLPDELAPPKRKKTPLELNADLLFSEFVCYVHLRASQGTYVPRLPSQFPAAAAAALPVPTFDRGTIEVDGTSSHGATKI